MSYKNKNLAVNPYRGDKQLQEMSAEDVSAHMEELRICGRPWPSMPERWKQAQAWVENPSGREKGSKG